MGSCSAKGKHQRVKFAGQTSSQAGKDGKWMVELVLARFENPREMTISGNNGNSFCPMLGSGEFWVWLWTVKQCKFSGRQCS